MTKFVSESIQPIGDSFDTKAIARAEPGLPTGFRWRDQKYTILARKGQWKGTAPEGGKAGNEVYLRRHYYELQMSDGMIWTVYFVRQTPKSGSPTKRWFLYTINQ